MHSVIDAIMPTWTAVNAPVTAASCNGDDWLYACKVGDKPHSNNLRQGSETEQGKGGIDIFRFQIRNCCSTKARAVRE